MSDVESKTGIGFSANSDLGAVRGEMGFGRRLVVRAVKFLQMGLLLVNLCKRLAILGRSKTQKRLDLQITVMSDEVTWTLELDYVGLRSGYRREGSFLRGEI